MRALIDADYMTYSCGFAVEHTDYLVDTATGNVVTDDVAYARQVQAEEAKAGNDSRIWRHTEVEPIENCLGNVKRQILQIAQAVEERFGEEPELEVFLTGSGNFREEIATIRPYKGNRDPRHKPAYYREIREYLVKRWGAKVCRGIEADDAVAIEQTIAPRHSTIICGIDKDLWQVPGYHYHAARHKFADIKPQWGLKHFYKQLLTGDTTDNIGGCYRVGKAAAARIIKEAEEKAEGSGLEDALYRACLQAYQDSINKYGPEKCGYDDADAALLENARLLWMLRDYGKPMWHPPGTPERAEQQRNSTRVLGEKARRAG